MSYAFTGVLNTHWNNEVVEYLASKFNSVNPRIIVLSKTVFINAILAKFDNVSFIINAANECLELSFAKVDKDNSRSILFDSGNRQSPNAFKRYFQNWNNSN